MHFLDGTFSKSEQSLGGQFLRCVLQVCYGTSESDAAALFGVVWRRVIVLLLLLLLRFAAARDYGRGRAGRVRWSFGERGIPRVVWVRIVSARFRFLNGNAVL